MVLLGLRWFARSRRTRVLGPLAAALLIAGAQLAGAAGPPITAGPPVTFTDPSGDSGTAPDITTVVVSNDAAGRIDFLISVPGQPTLASDATLYLVLNTDNNPVTGGPNTEGGDYYFILSGEDRTYGLYRWTGSYWADVPSGTETVSWTSGAHIAFDRSQLGNPAEVTFWVKTLQGSGTSEGGRVDFAPDFATWSYVLPVQIPSSPQVTVKQVLVTGSGTARAGRPYAIRVSLRFVVDGQAYVFGPDQLGCAAKVGARQVKTKVKPTSVAWTCSLVVPKTARGKTLVISLKGRASVSTDSGDVSTGFTKTVRVSVH
jgi:hypothetical protein